MQLIEKRFTRWQEWGEAALIELKIAYTEIQASGNHGKGCQYQSAGKGCGFEQG